jgi:hypothetical protein
MIIIIDKMKKKKLVPAFVSSRFSSMDVNKLCWCFIFILINGGIFTVECQQQNGMEDADAYLTTVSGEVNFIFKFFFQVHTVLEQIFSHN